MPPRSAIAAKSSPATPGRRSIWAERAVEIDPSRVEGWEQVIGLNWRLESDAAAIAACARAAAAFSPV